MRGLKVIGLLAFFAVFSSSSLFTAALSSDQRRIIQSNVLYFDIAKNDCASSSSPIYPAGASQQDLTERIETYITNTRPDSPLIPFAGDFVKYGEQYGVNPTFVVALAQKETSLGTAGYAKPPQYNVFNIRGNGPGGFGNYDGYKDAIRAVNELLAGDLYLGPPSNFTTIEEIMNRYAPPSENDTEAYIEFVNETMQKISGDSGSPGPNCNSFGLVNTEGYSFPVAPQKRSENGGVSAMSALPCNAATCHHDGTPAFDISRQPGGDAVVGTDIYAISEGEVDNVHIYRGIQGCYSLQLRSSKDDFWYYYTHIQNPQVKDGDKVMAGQKLAEIGPRECTGNGSDPHLHIDRGCVVDGVPQKGGRDACRDAGIIPLINSLFKDLVV